MTDKHKQLLAEGDALLKANNALLAKGPAITGDDLDAIEANNTKMAGIQEAIDVEVKTARRRAAAEGRSAEFDRFLNEPAGRPPMGATAGMQAIGTLDGAFKGLGFVADGEVEVGDGRELGSTGGSVISAKAWRAIHTKEYKGAFRAYLKDGLSGLTRDEYKNLEEGLDPQGGFLVPADMLQKIIAKGPTPTRLNGRVTNITTGRDSITMPKVNYNTNSTDDSTGILYSTPFRVTWTGENPSSATAARVTDTTLFGNKRIGVHTAMISGILTNDMVEDAAFPVQNWVADKFAETVELLKDYVIVNGSGVNQPFGLTSKVNSTGDLQNIKYVPSTNASALTADALFDTALDVPEQYEENLVWVFNKVSTYKALRKLKDGQQRYLFGGGYSESGLAAPVAKTLIDYPFIFSGFCDNVAANKYPIIFGDLRGYYFVNRIGFSIQVLREKYAEQNQIGLLGRVRFGADVVEPWRLRVHKVAVS